jgi:hypothetical protein
LKGGIKIMLNIELKPKYNIGDRIDKDTYIDYHLVDTKQFIINNIHAIYNFETKEIKYKYQLKTNDEFGFIDGWTDLI